MTVFKTFLKILNQCKVVILLYTAFLVAFGAFNMQTSESSLNFTASKPDILIVNQDQEEGVTKNLIAYLEKNSNPVSVKENEEARNDALFYRDVNYIIYIPEHYQEDFMRGQNPTIEIKSTGDNQASYAEMLLSRYLKVANLYQKAGLSEEEMIQKINQTLEKETQIEITSHLDTNNLEKASFYYNFANYSILAGSVYVICLILSSFKEEKIRKRTIISSTSYRKLNRQLLVCNSLFAIVLWLFYVVLSFILVGEVMFTIHGLIYIINSFLFTLCSVTIAVLIGNWITNKEAINGIVNVVALGSSFLCGAFVPVQWLPDSVLTIAHIFPSYYYINSNEIIKGLETIQWETIQPILINMGIIALFSFGFILLTNLVTRRKRKIG